MGVGFAVDLVVCSALGIDMYDCVFPTRTAVSILYELQNALQNFYYIIYESSRYLSFEFAEIRLRIGKNRTAQSEAGAIQEGR
jgi:hypothetical protein